MWWNLLFCLIPKGEASSYRSQYLGSKVKEHLSFLEANINNLVSKRKHLIAPSPAALWKLTSAPPGSDRSGKAQIKTSASYSEPYKQMPQYCLARDKYRNDCGVLYTLFMRVAYTYPGSVLQTSLPIEKQHIY